MKKYIWLSAQYLVIIGIFNMLCFVFIDDYTTSFYISLGFGNGAILIYAISALLFGKRKKFAYLSVQNALILSSYFVIAVVLNLIFALAKMQNITANWVTNVIILSIYAVIIFVITSANAASIEQVKHDKV